MMKSGKYVMLRAVRDTIPVMMGYVTMGIACGVLLATKGGVSLAPVWGGVMCLTVMSGTMQFAIVKPLAEAASLGAVAAMTFMINFRYFFYGFSLIERWRNVHIIKKIILLAGLSDETYALEMSRPYRDEKRDVSYCLRVSVLNMLYWFVGVVSGAIAGTTLPIPTNGIEFTMPALLLVILADQARDFVKDMRMKGGGEK